MLRKVILLCFFVVINAFQSAAQTALRGAVTDSSGTVIAGASVTIINAKGAGVSFSKSDGEGNFSFNLDQIDETLSLKVTAMGYRAVVRSLSTTSGQNLLITLSRDIIKLQEVTIKSKSLISKVSDTLKYDVKRFRENKDRVIADVIGRMPGIQVDEKGGISYNGKRISKVYIDGENLLDQSYKIATSNIPANAIDQLQVIEHDQPVKALNGYITSDDVSLNLVLNDSVKTMITNTGQVGVGNSAYLAELNNLFFRKGIKGINTFKTNNIGNDLYVEHEEVGQHSSNEFRTKDAQNYLSMQSEIIPDLQSRYYLMNNDINGSLNTLINMGQDWRLRLNVATLQLKRQYRFNNKVNYFLAAGDTISYLEEQDNVYRLNSWKTKLQIEKNSSNIYFRSQSNFEIPNWKRAGESSQNNQHFEQQQPMNQTSVSNQTKIVKALDAQSILEYNGLIQHQKIDERLNIAPGIHQEILNHGQNYAEILQLTSNEAIIVDQSIALRKKIGSVVLSSSFDFSFEKDKLWSDLLISSNDMKQTGLGEASRNNLIFQNLDLRAKFSALYRFKKGDLTLAAAPGYTSLAHEDQILKKSTKEKYFSLNPQIVFRNGFGKFSEMQLSYAEEKTFGEIKDIYSGIMLVNFRQFNSNDIPLPVMDLKTLSARYSFRRPISMFFYNIDLSYVSTKQNYIRSFIIESGQTNAVAIDFDNNLNEYNLGANLSKYLFFSKINLSLRSNISIQKGFTMYNNEVTPFTGTQLNAGVSLRKKIAKKMSFLLMYDFMQVVNEQQSLTANHTENVVNSHKLRAEWNHRIGNRLSYQLNYNLVSFDQTLQAANHNEFLDFNVKYANGKMRGAFELQCINLIGQQEYSQSSSNANELHAYYMPLRPRTFLLKYSFSF
jgi:hypothetical protein